MTCFLQNGDLYAPTPGKDALLDTLPVGNYIVVETMSGLMFKRVDAFPAPSGKMYGNIDDRADRIFNTFLDRERATGILLEGEKGSGKSQLARNISRIGYEHNVPTIIINAPFHGDAFNALLGSIEQPAVVLMDEFEKVYSEPQHQEQILTLLDGVMTSKKLFVLTVNDTYRVNTHMKNRPGRIYYSIQFRGLEQEFVREYCADNLNDADQIDNVLRVAALFQAFNFDMLKALIEEMNRYKESAFDALELLNAKPITFNDSTKYEGHVVTKSGVKSKVAETNHLPLGDQSRIGFAVEFEVPVPGPGQPSELKTFMRELGLDDDDFEEGEDVSHHFIIESHELKKVDVDGGRYEFSDGDFTFHFRRKPQETGYNLRHLEY